MYPTWELILSWSSGLLAFYRLAGRMKPTNLPSAIESLFFCDCTGRLLGSVAILKGLSGSLSTCKILLLAKANICLAVNPTFLETHLGNSLAKCSMSCVWRKLCSQYLDRRFLDTRLFTCGHLNDCRLELIHKRQREFDRIVWEDLHSTPFL